MLKFDVITLFPQLFTEFLANRPYKKAKELGVAEYNLWNLRDFALDSYGTVDDKTYGGGVGMVLMIEPIHKTLQKINGTKTVVLSPRGKKFTQEKAREFARLSQLTLICGRYEGIDARVEDNLADEVISIGDYVVSGGELPALVVMESVTRLLKGVLEKEQASEIESFSQGENLEYPQYTRPEDFNGLKVPPILLSGDHKKIQEWRESFSKTQKS